MARITRIVGPDGGVTTIKSKSTCGCVTFLLAAVVIAGPAAWFPLPVAIACYVGLGAVIIGLLAFGIAKGREQTQATTPADADWTAMMSSIKQGPPPPAPPPL